MPKGLSILSFFYFGWYFISILFLIPVQVHGNVLNLPVSSICGYCYCIKCVSSPTGFTTAINVICNKPRYVVILFQPVTLTCDYSTTATTLPLITWKYKSYCRDPIQAALNPSSADNAIAQSNPNYNPNIECADSARTVRIVASKQTAVTLAKDYQGRQISITNSKSSLGRETKRI